MKYILFDGENRHYMTNNYTSHLARSGIIVYVLKKNPTHMPIWAIHSGLGATCFDCVIFPIYIIFIS